MMIQMNENQTMKNETESYLQTNEVGDQFSVLWRHQMDHKGMETYLQQMKLISEIASQFCVGDTR